MPKREPESNPFMHRESWTRRLLNRLLSPRIPPFIAPGNALVGLAVLLSLVIAFSQGLDYMARPSETAATLSVLESKMALDFWGVIFLTFATTSLFGTIFEFWPAGILGHGVLAVNYLAIGSGVVWSLIDNWVGYGWNTGVIYICFAIFHYLVADSCYDEWAREWKNPTPPIEIAGEDFDGHADL